MSRAELRVLAQEIVKELRKEGVIGGKIMDISETAKMIGMSERYIYNHIDEIPHTKLGRNLKFFEHDIRKWMRR